MAGHPAAAYVRQELAKRQWTQRRLVAESGVNKTTINGFLRGNIDSPSSITLGRIEAALDLKPGTLAALEEDTPQAEATTRLAQLDDIDFTAELVRRLQTLREENARLRAHIAELARSLQQRPRDFVSGDNYRELGLVAHYEDYTPEEEADEIAAHEIP